MQSESYKELEIYNREDYNNIMQMYNELTRQYGMNTLYWPTRRNFAEEIKIFIEKIKNDNVKFIELIRTNNDIIKNMETDLNELNFKNIALENINQTEKLKNKKLMEEVKEYKNRNEELQSNYQIELVKYVDYINKMFNSKIELKSSDTFSTVTFEINGIFLNVNSALIELKNEINELKAKLQNTDVNDYMQKEVKKYKERLQDIQSKSLHIFKPYGIYSDDVIINLEKLIEQVKADIHTCNNTKSTLEKEKEELKKEYDTTVEKLTYYTNNFKLLFEWFNISIDKNVDFDTNIRTLEKEINKFKNEQSKVSHKNKELENEIIKIKQELPNYRNLDTTLTRVSKENAILIKKVKLKRRKLKILEVNYFKSIEDLNEKYNKLKHTSNKQLIQNQQRVIRRILRGIMSEFKSYVKTLQSETLIHLTNQKTLTECYM